MKLHQCSNCDNRFESGKGGVLGPPALCPKCNQRQRRGTDMDKRERIPADDLATIAPIRCTNDEKGRWEKAARKAKKAFADWAREAFDDKAK